MSPEAQGLQSEIDRLKKELQKEQEKAEKANYVAKMAVLAAGGELNVPIGKSDPGYIGGYWLTIETIQSGYRLKVVDKH